MAHPVELNGTSFISAVPEDRSLFIGYSNTGEENLFDLICLNVSKLLDFFCIKIFQSVNHLSISNNKQKTARKLNE